MRGLLLCIAGLFCAASASAQTTSYTPPIDLSGYATTSQLNSAVSGLPTASTLSTAISSLQAQIPTAAATVPGMEQIGGAAGSAGTYRPGNAIQPRITRVLGPDQPCTTNASGVCTASWTATSGGTPGVLPVPILTSATATQAPYCLPVDGTITTTGAQIKCFTSQSTSVTILGATVAPITTAAAGVKVIVFVIPPAS